MDNTEIDKIINGALDHLQTNQALYGLNFRAAPGSMGIDVDPQIDRALVGVLFPLVPEGTRVLIANFVVLARDARISAAANTLDLRTEAAKKAREKHTNHVESNYPDVRRLLEIEVEKLNPVQRQIVQRLGDQQFPLFLRD